jgi:hypothetical protein
MLAQPLVRETHAGSASVFVFARICRRFGAANPLIDEPIAGPVAACLYSASRR